MFAGKTAALLVAVVLGACSSPRPEVPPQSSPQSSPPAVAQGVQPMPAVPLAPSVRARNWDEFKVFAGRRMVAANPDGTYTDVVPEPLLAIPVLEIELNANGSVRRITVRRQPSQAIDTVQLAIDAAQRAAPYGDVSHLPKPWKFTEVFLFRDDRRFKPRALD